MSNLGLIEYPLRCPCNNYAPLELRQHRGYLVLARFCPNCGRAFDARATVEDWQAVSQLLSVLLDQAQRA